MPVAPSRIKSRSISSAASANWDGLMRKCKRISSRRVRYLLFTTGNSNGSTLIHLGPLVIRLLIDLCVSTAQGAQTCRRKLLQMLQRVLIIYQEEMGEQDFFDKEIEAHL